MAWAIEFVPEAANELKKLGRGEAARIIRTLEERIAVLDDPRSLGAPLVGEHAGYWRWRIGDYRVRVGRRREVYR
ncbi:type II toxin-antitoxin system RelE/ParE family toxin [Sphingomonas sp. IC-56]|uniref:type II toxin-antitoxin system RelE family toxin n=1 Tax=Sphingomonas sp. IC-56 TaxID=2898529 RepID=UPI001E3B6DD8|nr:type II toxin-antitoxin system RelE/ParE family toxin [Sphingomonas sp. IC-56]MCD2323488.1 type II toxin-antitoxin system RelE/ParE family toxin [Sphingomonas sp. IC-56]